MLKKKKIPFLAFFREKRRKRRRLYFLSRQNCAEVILFLNRKKRQKNRGSEVLLPFIPSRFIIAYPKTTVNSPIPTLTLRLIEQFRLLAKLGSKSRDWAI